MPALDYGVLSSLLSPPQNQPQPQQTSTDTSSVDQAQPLQQFDLPPVQVPDTGGSLNLADIPPAMGAVGSHPGRGQNKIQNIILHSSDGTESGDLNTLTQTHNAGAHFYVTRDGRVFPLVNLDDTAYHAGKVSDPSYSNESTIGIEQEHFDAGKEYPNGQDWPDAQVQSTAKLVAALQTKYGLGDNNVLYHSQVAFPAGRKQDPYNYPRDRFDQFVAAAKSGSPVAQTSPGEQQPLTVPPIVYPWQAMDPKSVTLGDVMQQQQQRETGNIVMSNPAPQTPTLQVRATHYAYPGDPNLDPNSAKGLGVANRQLGPNSVGLSPDVEQSLQAKLGDQFVVTGADGSQRQVTFDDRTNQLLTGRVDFYDPDGTIGDQGNVSIARVGQPQQAQQIGSIQYPWSAQTAAVNPDQINQAVQQALQRNAFASTQTGVPAGYNQTQLPNAPLTPPPATQLPNAPLTGDQQRVQLGAPVQGPVVQAQPPQKVGLVLSQAGDTQAKMKPESFGMRVATGDDVKAYDSYLANGGDPSQIDPYDRLAVMLAKNPQALRDPRNAQLLDEMVVQPQKAASAKIPLQQKVWDAVNSSVAGIGDAGNSIAAVARAAWKDVVPAVRGLAEKMSGQTPDPEALAGMTDIPALEAQGVGKTASDVYNFLSQIGLTAVNGSLDLASMFTRDPQKLQQLHMQKLLNMQSLAGDQQQVANVGSNLQSTLANAYSATGAFADVGQKLKTWQADPQAVEGISQIAQLLGPGALESLAGMKVAGAFKPLLAERALETTTDVAEARARKFFFDSTQAVPRDAEAEAANSKYFDIRNGQAQLAPDARAADAAYQQESANLQQQLTSLNRISTDPGTATQFAQTMLSATGGAVNAAGDAMGKLNGLGDRLMNALSLGSPTLRSLYDKMFRVAAYGTAASMGHGWAGRLAEFGIDALEHADAIPKAASGLNDLFKTMGQELAYGETSIPYWTRVSQGNRLVPPRMAAFLDSPLVQTIGAGIKGTAPGMATGAFLGALSDPNDPLSGAISNAIPGGLFGMAGGGFGQWLRYNSPGEVYLSARGDWKRTLDTMAGPQRDQFLSLQPKDQLMLSTYLQQVPGLRVNFEHNPAGPEGSFDPHIHTFDTANKPTITVNLANPEGTVRGIFAHELMHATQTAGMTPDIYDALLGNVDRGVPGQYTALDARGNPMGVDPATSRYTTNQEFQNFKNDYVTSLARSGQPTAHLSDLDIARELFAEHGVDHLLSAQGAVDATSAFRPSWVNRNMLKNAYAKLGFVFDQQGNMVQGTHLFDNVRQNDAVDKLTQKYFQTQFRERALNSEELPTRKWTMEDLRKTNAADTFLDTAPEIMRNPDGSVMRDSRGMPLMRSAAQVKAYNAKLANDTLDRINALPEERKAEIGLRQLPNGNTFVRYLPQELRDGLAKTNEYNPHQIAALNALSEQLADNTRMGTNFRMFYHKALSEGKRYGSFAGTEKFAVPYGFEISKNDNVLLRSVDFDQLNDNYLRNATRAPFRQLWNNPSEFTQDWNTYFQNHARGEPGATGIGEAKRDAINSLLRLDTSVNRDANPLLEARGGKGFANTRPIIKSYRIDRASQVTPLEMSSPFTTEEQYYRMNRNFRPGSFEQPPTQFEAASHNMRPLGYRAAVRLTNGEVFSGSEHAHALDNAAENGSIRVSDKTTQFGFVDKNKNFISMEDADRLLEKNWYEQRGLAAPSFRPRTGEAELTEADKKYFQELANLKKSGDFMKFADLRDEGPPDINGIPSQYLHLFARKENPAAVRNLDTGEIKTADAHFEATYKHGNAGAMRAQLGTVFNDNLFHPDIGHGRLVSLKGEGEPLGEEAAKGTTPNQWYQAQQKSSGISYRPRGTAAAAAPSQFPEAIPVTTRLDKDGKPQPVPIPYDITKSPLIADKYPLKLAKDAPDRMSSQFSYINPTEGRRLTALDDASAVTTFANQLVPMLKAWLKDPEIAPGKEWYDTIGDKLQGAFGKGANQFMELLAATSPMKRPHANFLEAYEAKTLADNGHYDRHVDLYNKARDMQANDPEGFMQHVQGLTGNAPPSQAKALAAYIDHHDILPKKANGQKYGFNSEAVLRVLADRWRDDVKGPKTPQFNKNITGEHDGATIDDWAARTLREIGYKGQEGHDQWRIQPASKTGVSNEDFAFGQLVFKRAAEKLGMKPKEGQALAWVGEQDKWVKNGWADIPSQGYDKPFDLAFPKGGKPLSVEQLRQALNK